MTPQRRPGGRQYVNQHKSDIVENVGFRLEGCNKRPRQQIEGGARTTLGDLNARTLPRIR
jgi:hypothetical protein